MTWQLQLLTKLIECIDDFYPLGSVWIVGRTAPTLFSYQPIAQEVRNDATVRLILMQADNINVVKKYVDYQTVLFS